MTAPAATPKAAWWEDFIDVYVNPSKLFDRRSDGKFGHALTVLLIGLAVLYFATASAMQPVLDVEFSRQVAAAMAQNPNLTAEQVRAGQGFFQTFGGIVLPIVMGIGTVLLASAVLLVGKVFGAKLRFATAMVIATFAMLPRLIEMVTNAFQALLLDESAITSRFSVTLGVGRFLDIEQTGLAMMSFLGRIDVFTLWVTILIGVGYRRIGKLDPAMAGLAAAVIWFVGAAPVLLQGLRGG